MHELPIKVRGTVLAVLKPELCEVSLPNGKVTLGHLSRELKKAGAEPKAGSTVEMEMTPFDFDSGRIASIDREPDSDSA